MHLIELIGGIAFFFYGLESTRNGLHTAAAARVKAVLGHITSNRFVAGMFGALITLVFQSSGAISAMLVNFVHSRLITVRSAVAVLLGADIGTTLVVVLLSIKSISQLGLLIVSAGFFISILSGKKKIKRIGGIILGFGLIFYGLNLMTEAAMPLNKNELAIYTFKYLSSYPWVTLLFATIISSLIHSAGTIGIAIALAFAGAIDINTAIPIVLGANLGTCSTAVLASIGLNNEGKQVAFSHVFSKIIGILIVMPFLPYISQFLVGYFSSETLAFQIAISHVLFNVFLSAFLIIFLEPFLYFMRSMFPVSLKDKEQKFGPKFLNKAALELPDLAFAQVKREITRVGNLAKQMLNDCLRIFSKGLDVQEEIERISQLDDKIDVLEKAIRFYLAELGQTKLLPEQANRQLALLSIAADFEEIGDTISRELVMLARKKMEWHRFFSDEGWIDLRNFQEKLLEETELTMSVLANPSDELLNQLKRFDENMQKTEQELRHAHLCRLAQGMKESFDTSSLHLDILANLRRISTKLLHIGEAEISSLAKQVTNS